MNLKCLRWLDTKLTMKTWDETTCSLHLMSANKEKPEFSNSCTARQS